MSGSPLMMVQARHGWMIVPTSDVFVGKSYIEYGEYSAGEVNIFRKLVHVDDNVIDVGANIGGLTVPLAQAVGGDGRVIAFEPQLAVANLLRANVAVNELQNVTVRRQAIGAMATVVNIPRFNLSVEGNYGGIGREYWGSGELTAQVTLDSVVLPSCSFVKIDVEGMELEVLQGGVNFIAIHRPVLFVENDREGSTGKLICFIRETLHYRPYWVFTPLFNQDNFAKNPTNVFEGIVSFNMICVPETSQMEFAGLREALPDDSIAAVPWSEVINGL